MRFHIKRLVSGHSRCPSEDLVLLSLFDLCIDLVIKRSMLKGLRDKGREKEP